MSRRPAPPAVLARCCASIILALAGGAGRLAAQSVLEYDHATRQARLIEVHGATADTTPLAPGTRKEVRTPARVQIRVSNTNTALYRFSERAVAAAPQVEPLRSFMGTLKPYLPEVALLTGGVRASGGRRGEATVARSILPSELSSGVSVGVERAWAAGRRAELDVATIDHAVYGARGLQQTHTLTLLALEQMRTGQGVAQAAASLRDSLQLTGDGCASGARTRQLPVTLALAEALEDLSRARFDLQQSVLQNYEGLSGYAGFGGLPDSLMRIGRAADSASADYERLLNVAYQVETLALIAAYACPTWTGGNVRVNGNTEQTITLSIDPRTEPELARVADRGNAAYTVTLAPRWTVRPSLGASFLVAPNGTFSKFGARTTATGGTTEVFESAIQDSRFSWGVTLGFTWRGLSIGREQRPTMAFWLPELTVNPTGDIKSFAVGGGISTRFLKLGAGLIWIRHSELVDLTLGQTLPNKDFLRVRDSYRSPKLYFSLSVFDWPPFLAK